MMITERVLSINFSKTQKSMSTERVLSMNCEHLWACCLYLFKKVFYPLKTVFYTNWKKKCHLNFLLDAIATVLATKVNNLTMTINNNNRNRKRTSPGRSSLRIPLIMLIIVLCASHSIRPSKRVVQEDAEVVEIINPEIQVGVRCENCRKVKEDCRECPGVGAKRCPGKVKQCGNCRRLNGFDFCFECSLKVNQ